MSGPTAPLVLVVDDVEQNRLLLSEVVESLGYRVEAASGGAAALALLGRGVDLVLLDIMMPGLDGYQVTERLRADPRFAELPVIMVTALDGRNERIHALRAGANDYITKPVDRTELEVRIGSQLKLQAARQELHRHQADLEGVVAARTDALRRAVAELAEAQRRTSSAHLDTIRRLVLAAELKDTGTARHIVRIGQYAAVIARALGLPPNEVERLAQASTLHDVGKIGIPDAILAKRGPLSADERRIMEDHPLIGGRILAGSPSELIQIGRTIALTHHERWDGGGYPQGLAGEEIPLYGRICSVADVFDALTTDRPYRVAMSPAAALALMREESGSRFDPRLLDLFLLQLDEVLAIWRGFQTERPAARASRGDERGLACAPYEMPRLQASAGAS